MEHNICIEYGSTWGGAPIVLAECPICGWAESLGGTVPLKVITASHDEWVKQTSGIEIQASSV